MDPRPPSSVQRPRRFVVTGEPNTGKTTFVEKWRQRGDVVWDQDAIAAVLIGVERHAPMGRHLPMVISVRDIVVKYLRHRDDVSCFVIISDADDAWKVAEEIGAFVYTMPRDRDCDLAS